MPDISVIGISEQWQLIIGPALKPSIWYTYLERVYTADVSIKHIDKYINQVQYYLQTYNKDK